jgi:hypothetical protein
VTPAGPEARFDCHCHVSDHLVPDPADRTRIMWTTPRRPYGLTP